MMSKKVYNQIMKIVIIAQMIIGFKWLYDKHIHEGTLIFFRGISTMFLMCFVFSMIMCSLIFFSQREFKVKLKMYIKSILIFPFYSLGTFGFVYLLEYKEIPVVIGLLPHMAYALYYLMPTISELYTAIKMELTKKSH